MGKRGQKHTKKAATGGPPSDPLDILGSLIRPIAPNKRHELNQLVDKLFELASNFGHDAVTPKQLWEEHLKIRALGLRATRDIAQSELVIAIPRKVIMSVDTARQSEMGRLIEKDAMLQTMNNVTLALHLLLEKTSPASFWEPYINTLPPSYHTVLYYTEEEFNALKGSPAYLDALKQYKFVARQYAYFYKKFQSTMLKDYFTFDEYRWAVSTVMTRQNQIPSGEDPQKVVNALVPFWDMANHENGTISTDFDTEGDVVKCMAFRNFKSGEPFRIFYGERNNHDLLVHNGFVFPDNRFNSLQIRLGISKNDPLAQDKYDMLSRLVISPQGQFVIGKDADQPFDQLLLAFLRVMCLQSQDEIDLWSHEDKIRDLLNPEADPDLDNKVFQYMKTRCDLLLKSYPTSLEEDEKALQNVDLPATLKSCVILRQGVEATLDGEESPMATTMPTGSPGTASDVG
ncbi:hypothetical protein TCAL_14603 [Tigriopus californicus]|uniref:protein-histidine N-methyltransferase n=1 Tax=Tigriopus californicus TaxID=6832 RepID=A0A553PDC1_TIGCA|nr:hypothetical protein TCAL_14603 [Tigriopus californicus]